MAIDGLNLGDVGFSLTAGTEGLDAAIAKLRTFGDAVNSWAKKTDNASQEVAAALLRQERKMVDLYQKITNLQQQAGRIKAPQIISDESTASLKRYVDTLTLVDKYGHPLVRNAVEMQRAGAIATQQVNDLSNALKNWQVSAKEAAAAQKLADQAAAQMSAARVKAAVASLVQPTGLKARESFQVFDQAGKIPYEGSDANAQVLAYKKHIANIQSESQAITQNANAHVMAYKAKMAAMDRYTWQLNSSANAHVHAYQKEQAAVERSVSAQVEQLNRLASRYKVNPSFATANISNLQAFRDARLSGDTSAASQALARLREGLDHTDSAISKARTSTASLVLSMRNLERATIIAAGPLSGIGARIAVMAALFETGTAKTALFIGGIVGAATGMGFLTAAAIRAEMEWQKWVGLLTAASGSQALVNQEFEYATSVANKYGLSIKGLIPSYANFATSARLAGLSLEDQHKVFEAITTAGAALRWNTDQTGRAFLALEQMMSKGTVQTQELKLQMGQVLPGAFEIAAKAIGKTQSELSQMLQKGELLSVDFLPKFAAAIKEVYSASAIFGSQSIQAELGRFDTNKFAFAKSFSDAVSAGQAFRNVMITVNSTLEYVSKNMSQFLSLTLAGFSTLAVTFIPGIVSGFVKVVAGLREMTIWATTFEVITSGGILGIVAKLGLMAATGVATYSLIRKATADNNNDIQKQIALHGEAIQQYLKMGGISKREREAAIQDLQKQTKIAQQQLVELSKSYDDLAKSVQNASIWQTISNSLLSFFSDDAATRGLKDQIALVEMLKTRLSDIKSHSIMGNIVIAKEGGYDNAIAKIQGRIKEEQSKLDAMIASRTKNDPAAKLLRSQIQTLKNDMEAYSHLAEIPDPKNEPALKSFDHAKEAIQKLINKYKELEGEQKALSAGKLDSTYTEEAKRQVEDFFATLDRAEDKQKTIAKLASTYAKAFRDLGIHTGSFKSDLIALYEHNNRFTASLERQKRELRDLPQTYERLHDALSAMDDKIAENNAILMESEATRSAAKRAAELRKEWDKIAGTILNSGMSFEEMSKQVDKLTNRIDALKAQNITLDALDKVREDTQRAQNVITQEQERLQGIVTMGIITQTEATRRLNILTSEQGDILNKETVPAIQKLIAQIKDPAVVASLQAWIEKTKVMQAAISKNSATEGLRQGTLNYLDTFKTAYQSMAEISQKTFQGIEDSLVNLVMTGKAGFGDLVKTVIAGMARVVIQTMIMKPIADWFRTAFVPSFSTGQSSSGSSAGSSLGGSFFGAVVKSIGNALFNAKGNAFEAGQRVQAFANGGIFGINGTVVNQPTFFPMANGGIGLAGESGPEGVLPLKRNSAGQLGVIASATPSASSGAGGGLASIQVEMTFNDNRTTTSSTASQGTSNDKDNISPRLADMLKNLITSHLIKEQRPGGLLYSR